MRYDRITNLFQIAVMTAILLQVGYGGNTEPDNEPPDHDETAKTDILETGASALQTDPPLELMNMYLVGFYAMKENLAHQIEANLSAIT